MSDESLDDMERALRDAARVAIDGKVTAFEVRMMMRHLGEHGFVVVPSVVPCDGCVELELGREADRRRITELETALGEVLGAFYLKAHPGYDGIRTGWERVERVAKWRSVLAAEHTQPDAG